MPNIFLCFVAYTDIQVSQITQKLAVHYSGSVSTLHFLLLQLAGHVEKMDEVKSSFRVFDVVDLTVDKNMITVEVSASVSIHKFI